MLSYDLVPISILKFSFDPENIKEENMPLPLLQVVDYFVHYIIVIVLLVMLGRG